MPLQWQQYFEGTGRDLGCREVGTQRVKGTGPGTGGGFKDGKYSGTAGRGDYTGTAFSGFADADGLETVAAWECVEGCAVRMLDEQSGERPSGAWNGHRNAPKTQNAYGHFSLQDERSKPADTGGASRFFYCAKASTAERDGSRHPTVKPLALMSWLVTLVTPPGGTVLDPFMGSGTTLIAADRLGFDAIGIDNDPESVADAQRRLSADAGLFANLEVL